MMNTFSGQLPWEALQLHTDDLYLSMGQNYVPDVGMEQMLAVMKKEIAEVCHPRFVYSFFDAESVERSHVCIHGIKLHTGGVITPYLQQANQ